MILSTIYLIKKAIRDDQKIKDESKQSKETQMSVTPFIYLSSTFWHIFRHLFMQTLY